MVEYLNQLNENCSKCPELARSRKRITWGYGNIKSPVVFIGEAPGYLGCDVTGIPFRGDKSGDLYEKMLASIDLTTELVYTTNAVKCCPPGNRTPTDEEVMNCRYYLFEELKFIEPELIVPMGKTAIKTFDPFVSAVLKLWDKQRASSYGHVFCLPHPAFITRNLTTYEPRYQESFQKIKEIICSIS